MLSFYGCCHPSLFNLFFIHMLCTVHHAKIRAHRSIWPPWVSALLVERTYIWPLVLVPFYHLNLVMGIKAKLWRTKYQIQYIFLSLCLYRENIPLRLFGYDICLFSISQLYDLYGYIIYVWRENQESWLQRYYICSISKDIILWLVIIVITGWCSLICSKCFLNNFASPS